MPISVSCAGCSATFSVKDEYAGKRARCPKCGEPLTVPAAASPAPAPPVVARPVAAARVPTKPTEEDASEAPKPKRRLNMDDDENEPVRPTRKRGDSRDEDDSPRRRRGGDDDEPRSRRRRRHDDDAPKKSKLPLILGILGGLFLLCAGGCAGGWFLWIVPAAEKARAANSRLQAEINRIDKETELPSPDAKPNLPWSDPILNNRLTPGNVASLRAGMTMLHVEEFLLVGSPATATHVTTATAGLPNAAGANDRWQDSHRVGRVFHWQNRDDHVLVSFTDSPNKGGTVNGVVAVLGGKASEPVKLLKLEDKTPVATLTVAELAEQHATHKDKWITLKGQYKTMSGGEGGTVVLMAPTGKTQVVHPPAGTKFAFKTPPQPFDDLEFTGKVGGNDRLLVVYDATLVSQSPTTEKPVEMTADEITAEFDKDADAATKKYEGKLLKVTGTVNAGGNTGARLGFRGVQTPAKKKGYFLDCTFDGDAREAAKGVKLGDTATIVGRFGGFKKGTGETYTITLTTCRLVK